MQLRKAKFTTRITKRVLSIMLGFIGFIVLVATPNILAAGQQIILPANDATFTKSNIGCMPNSTFSKQISYLSHNTATLPDDDFVPVTDIIDVPNETTPGTPVVLTGTIVPANASRTDIIWSIKDAGLTGATLNDNILSPVNAGAVTVTATIKDGALGYKIFNLASGNSHAMTILADGSLWGWGFNTFGQLGDNTAGNIRLAPVRVGTEIDWAILSPGLYNTVAIKKDGSLWSWGYNKNGQLGDGTTIDHLYPMQIGMDTDWSAIAMGNLHCLAKKEDGSLWAWGSNEYGQLGDGSTIDRLSPKRLGEANDWAVISAGYNHTVALKMDGSLWAWGQNSFGQLGNGTATTSLYPVQIGVDTDWIKISAGGYHNLALKADGSLWAWGLNSNGQVGDASIINRYSPQRIGTGNDWDIIEAGGRHSLSLKKDGSLWTWGQNTYGQLGNGTLIDSSAPGRIGTATDWSILAAGDYHSLALTKDAALWAFGQNSMGQFGNSNTSGSLVPIKITNFDYTDFTKDFTIVVRTPTTVEEAMYKVFLIPDKKTAAAGDTIYMDLMLVGKINYFQLTAELAFDTALLEYAGYEDLRGWVAEVTNINTNKILVRQAPSINTVFGEPCKPPVKIVTLKFTVKYSFAGPIINTDLIFTYVVVGCPRASFVGVPTAIGKTLSLALLKD
ncbi:MAG: hypothetical protein FWG61_06095 [Firmicutes bacterium]|nr:hypothetical protein [Bacillota bacterium]